MLITSKRMNSFERSAKGLPRVIGLRKPLCSSRDVILFVFSHLSRSSKAG